MNTRRFLSLIFVISGALVAQDTGPTFNAPARNWVLPLFTKEGFRSMTLRGGEMREGAKSRYDFVELQITTYSGKADTRLESDLMSPIASFFPAENRAQGAGAVRFISYRDEIEIVGERWTYTHAEQKLSIQKNNRVVFHAQLPDLLR